MIVVVVVFVFISERRVEYEYLIPNNYFLRCSLLSAEAWSSDEWMWELLITTCDRQVCLMDYNDDDDVDDDILCLCALKRVLCQIFSGLFVFDSQKRTEKIEIMIWCVNTWKWLRRSILQSHWILEGKAMIKWKLSNQNWTKRLSHKIVWLECDRNPSKWSSVM